jgi:hypothetical protein
VLSHEHHECYIGNSSYPRIADQLRIKAQKSVNWDLQLQNKINELEYAQLKGSSDAKLRHSNPLLLIRNAMEILNIHRLLFMADDSQHEDRMRRILKSIYGYQDGAQSLTAGARCR